jgi:hypothetical protein
MNKFGSISSVVTILTFIRCIFREELTLDGKCDCSFGFSKSELI